MIRLITNNNNNNNNNNKIFIIPWILVSSTDKVSDG